MNGISSIGGGNSWMFQGPRQRPDSAKMAEQLFSKLDTSGTGSLSKADLQSALDKVSSSNSTSSTSSTDVDTLFAQLDTNGDSKVTKSEFTSAVDQLTKQLDEQFQQMRIGNAMQEMNGGVGGMPPPPPPGANDAGFTKDELQSQLSEMGSSDDKRSELISKIANNFDEADSNGDGKVSAKEAMTYDQSTSASASCGTGADITASSSTDSDTTDRMFLQLMRLMEAYGVGQGQSEGHNSASSLSILA